MKRGDDMLGMRAWVKGRCLTEKGFKRHIMGRKSVPPVTKELGELAFLVIKHNLILITFRMEPA